MTKQEFLEQLQNGLGALTESDARERLNFYSEMIDDRMEEGLSEQEAVAQIGDVNEIIASILDEIPQRTPEQMPAKIEQPAQQKEAPILLRYSLVISSIFCSIPAISACQSTTSSPGCFKRLRSSSHTFFILAISSLAVSENLIPLLSIS